MQKCSANDKTIYVLANQQEKPSILISHDLLSLQLLLLATIAPD